MLERLRDIRDRIRAILYVSVAVLSLTGSIALLIAGLIIGSSQLAFVGAIILFICIVPIVAMVAQEAPFVGAVLFLVVCGIFSFVGKALLD